MNIYLVGGAVRDHFLRQAGHISRSSSTDRDWVVVGETEESMLAAGYRKVGASFPVFLHPETGEEYALARRERKVAPGHGGFAFEFGPDVTLEEDLYRRDLTINAMAAKVDPVTGAFVELFDPFQGIADICWRQLRVVNSTAFLDDPLRYFRLARFAAMLPTFEVMRHNGFAVRSETESLSPERVFAETSKALVSSRPSRYFAELRRMMILSIHFPAIGALQGVPDRHIEGNAYAHTMLALDAAPPDAIVRWMALYHDVGKARTDKALWPRHYGHEGLSGPIAREELTRLRAPSALIDIVTLFARVHMKLHRWRELRPSTVLDIIESAEFSPEALARLLLAALTDERGRLLLSPRSPECSLEEARARAGFFYDAMDATRKIQGRLFVDKHGEGPQIGNLIHEARVNAIKRIKR